MDTFIFDIEKLFDTHSRELFSCGIGGTTLEWIDSFLILKTAASCCKRSEVRLRSSFVGCPTGRRSLAFVVYDG